MTATFSKKSFASLRVPPVFIYVLITRHFKLACVVVVFLFRTKDICFCSRAFDFLKMVDELEEDVAWMDDRASLAFGRFPQMVLL